MNDSEPGPIAIATPEELEQRIALLIDVHKFNDARRSLAEGLAHYPDRPRLLYLSAFVDWVEDRNEEARQTLSQLLRLEPHSYGGRSLLAQIQEDQGQLADAERTWIELLHDYPEDADLLGRYGNLMLRTLHVEKARALAQAGLRLEPENPHCLFVFALCEIADGRPMADNEGLAALLQHHPDRARTGLVLINALIDQRRPRAALDVAQGLLRAQPDSSELVEVVQSLRRQTHWSMLPLYPVQRWGMTASLAMWGVVAFGLPVVAPSLPDKVGKYLALAWFAYCVYSWVWPPLARKVLK